MALILENKQMEIAYHDHRGRGRMSCAERACRRMRFLDLCSQGKCRSYFSETWHQAARLALAELEDRQVPLATVEEAVALFKTCV
jgi:hypothetical protein